MKKSQLKWYSGNDTEKISIRKSDAALPCDFLLKFYFDMKMPKVVSN